MLHVTCDVIGVAQYHFIKSKMAAMYFALYQNFKLFFYFVPFICRFYNSETSLNFSSLIGNFLKKIKLLIVMTLL